MGWEAVIVKTVISHNGSSAGRSRRAAQRFVHITRFVFPPTDTCAQGRVKGKNEKGPSSIISRSFIFIFSARVLWQ